MVIDLTGFEIDLDIAIVKNTSSTVAAKRAAMEVYRGTSAIPKIKRVTNPQRTPVEKKVNFFLMGRSAKVIIFLILSNTYFNFSRQH